MKKKVIVLLLILVMVSSFFVGCDLFTKDGYRDYHQVVATINYDTKDSGVISSVLYKGELLSYVQNYGAAYISYYGMTAEEVVEYFYDSLTKQKLIVLYAQEYLYKNDAVPSSFKSEFSSLGAWEGKRAALSCALQVMRYINVTEPSCFKCIIGVGCGLPHNIDNRNFVVFRMFLFPGNNGRRLRKVDFTGLNFSVVNQDGV